MQGAGNDFVFVNCFAEPVENPQALARFVNDRHFGIGGDGLVLIEPSETADFRMRMFNPDGSEAMCGNALRCFGKFLYARGLTDSTLIAAETIDGNRTLELKLSKVGEVEQVTVDMGEPELRPVHIPVNSTADRYIDQPISIDGDQYQITCVSMGNPHAVVFAHGIDDLDLTYLGPKFEHHPLFPDRVNTEFIELTSDPHKIKMRVWERGAGETLACGTGSCAAAVAGVLTGMTPRDVTIKLRGGDLHIRWDEQNNHVYMTGGAEFVFDGELAD